MARFFLLLALNVVFASSLHVATVDCPFGYGTNCGGGGKLSSATKAEVGAILEGILKNLSAHKSLVESKKSVQKVTSVEGAQPVLAAPVKAAMQSLVSTMRSNSQKAAADIVDSAVNHGYNFDERPIDAQTKAQVAQILEGIISNLSKQK
jgi:hypothetical protein